MSGWTEDRVRLLRELWGAGHTSAEIGEALGITRNAVIGKVHRMGFSRGGQTVVKKKPTVRSLVPQKPTAVKVTVLPNPCRPKPLETLGVRECRYPTNQSGAGELHLFCAAPVEDMKPYCPAHYAVVYRPAPKGMR